MTNTAIRTDGGMLAQGRELEELPEPCFCVLYLGARSTKTHVRSQEGTYNCKRGPGCFQ